ncbi:hypothetical protein F511_27343 [Dorcoceras hygrometricum]|uniref:Uncharacterized protein n=1 Tax=Dorcoceras hygrometricum TaxID=472368 RepID=A0A2Z7B4G8_9LAMI|nr:hypothetical protein F511_27343 [Dorcoceras hygrometricum]
MQNITLNSHAAPLRSTPDQRPLKPFVLPAPTTIGRSPTGDLPQVRPVLMGTTTAPTMDHTESTTAGKWAARRAPHATMRNAWLDQDLRVIDVDDTRSGHDRLWITKLDQISMVADGGGGGDGC